MFQGLRASSPFYILYKNEPRVAIGEVISVSNPVPQFGATAYQNGLMTTPKSFVDIKVRVGEEVLDLQKLPADSTIADFGGNGMVVSESREAIINEVDGFKKASERVLADVGRHRKIVSECDKMLSELSPQLKREAEQAEEIENLKQGMGNLRDDLADIKALLSKALNRSPKKED